MHFSSHRNLSGLRWLFLGAGTVRSSYGDVSVLPLASAMEVPMRFLSGSITEGGQKAGRSEENQKIY